ncbi:UvrD-helicase domain-containing protein [Patescibacteria group bacterium]|nr:UvrD-helicase domain-containing protein [Patescibacteria group bacterium]
MNDAPYLAGLNSAQRDAVLATAGPVLVLAGAGSGKTRVITHRIVHLVHQGTAPHNILAVTFTNKAAGEMRERVGALLQKFPPSERAVIDSLPVVTTFHAFGVRMLREFHEVMGLRKHFTILDRSDSLRAIKQGLTEAQYDPKEFEPRKVLGMISRAKGDGMTPLSYRDAASSYPEEVAATVWGKYEAILAKEQSLDFDDLLQKTYRLLSEHPTVRTVLQQRFAYIHVDEYQDTNRLQFDIVKLLAGDDHNICVVGDIDQNIYSWRGADIKNVLQFERSFPGARTIVLAENYRSTGTIISASNEIIAKNKNRIEKEVFTSNGVGDKISLFAAMSGGDEADYIARTAAELIKTGTAPSEVAVLYRTNFQSRSLEEAFLRNNIPYQLLGTKFFERREVKDILSYLRLALNPDSQSDLARVVNEPARGIGKVTLLKLIEGKRSELSGKVREKVDEFYAIMTSITEAASISTPSDLIKFIMKRSGYEAMLKEQGTEEDLERLENLRELVSVATRYDDLAPEDAVTALLERAALESDQDELKNRDEQDAVRLMTIHAAKGLEFSQVFISGLEEGLFPHERLDDARIDHEEERRLFYVALTRAKHKLHLTYAHLRTIYGTQRVNVPSSFLNDISSTHIEIDQGGRWTNGSGYETTIYLD